MKTRWWEIFRSLYRGAYAVMVLLGAYLLVSLVLLNVAYYWGGSQNLAGEADMPLSQFVGEPFFAVVIFIMFGILFIKMLVDIGAYMRKWFKEE